MILGKEDIAYVQYLKIPSRAGAEKAFEKLKDSIGIDTLAATLILIDPKDKPSDDNERKIEEFCKDI